MQEKYSLNEQTLQFLIHFESNVESGKTYSTKELVDIFERSPFNKEQFNTYRKTKSSSIWWALKRSGKWLMIQKAVYKKI